MKKIICLIFIFFAIQINAFTQELKGGVTFDVNSAREYLQEGQINTLDISGPFDFNPNDNFKKIVYTKDNYGGIIGVTVQYKNDINKAYIYGRDLKLKYVDNYDRNIDIYPHRGYRYDLNGDLILTSLSVSQSEHYRFSPQGKLIAHSINGIVYDENGKIIGFAKGE